MLEHCSHSHAGNGAHPFAFPGATDHYAADRPVRTEHLKLEVALDFQRREVSGTCTTTVRAVRAVEVLSFDAVELELEWARVDGKNVEATNSGRTVRLQLKRALKA